MQQVELLVALLAVIGAVGAISQKLKIALPILLVLTGMAISLAPSIPAVKLNPDVVFFIFLPPLLYMDAFNTPWKELKDVADSIAMSAVGLVLATVVAVAAAVHAVVPGMPWAVALAMGAIVSPTDAVAASAISKDVKMPKTLLDIIKGESLVNDATGLVAYQFAVAAVCTGAFSWTEAGTRFFYVSLGGVAIGYALGWLLSKLRTRLDHTPVEIIASLLSPYVVYLAAEHLHLSSVLAVVTAALYLGWRSPRMQNSQTRLQLVANWETLVYLLNGFCFLLMGLQLRPVLETARAYKPGELLLWTATAALAPILVRFAWAFIVVSAYYFLKGQAQPCWKDKFVFSWSGMRGVVSLAAALALPFVCANGQPFPHRDLLVFLTIVVIAATLIFQGLTLPAIVKKFGFQTDISHSQEEERKARLFLSREGVRSIDELARANSIDLDHPDLQRILNKYLDHAIANIDVEEHSLTTSELLRSLQLQTIASQRSILIRMRETHEIDEGVFRVLQKELDLEEVHLNGRQ
jgi:CPA1 family monovalent cation:H+ antiporter